MWTAGWLAYGMLLKFSYSSGRKSKNLRLDRRKIYDRFKTRDAAASKTNNMTYDMALKGRNFFTANL